MKDFLTRLTEPSSYAGIGMIVSGVASLGLGHPVAIVITQVLTGIGAVFVKEKTN